jgi:large subunit ribosomal protein L17
MRHGVAGRKLGRNSSSRRALSTAQATALLRHGRIETTLAKAKELQPYVERLITTAKKAPATTPNLRHKALPEGKTAREGDDRRMATPEEQAATAHALHLRRIVGADIKDKAVLKKLFDDIAPRFSNRPGGYTRILRTGVRRGDNAPTALIELVDYELPAAS